LRIKLQIQQQFIFSLKLCSVGTITAAAVEWAAPRTAFITAVVEIVYIRQQEEASIVKLRTIRAPPIWQMAIINLTNNNKFRERLPRFLGLLINIMGQCLEV
jgi:hypothetical protein